MPVVRWVFTDPETDASYTFDINPLSGGSPDRAKRTSSNSLGPAGAVVLYEGQRPALRQEFSGTILTLEHYAAFVTWWKKGYPIQIEDDLGRVLQVLFESFSPKRVYSPARPYKHTYTAKTLILSMVDLDELVALGGYADGYGGGYDGDA